MSKEIASQFKDHFNISLFQNKKRAFFHVPAYSNEFYNLTDLVGKIVQNKFPTKCMLYQFINNEKFLHINIMLHNNQEHIYHY
ncbi:hypothetical protein CEAn_00083 [Coxiella endosymbiont of Amblyomma nuttalli]|nr:hypothetical protein CEAn_00083 [Coxiella endosymbiont of Amblyomma nuttalli]